MSQPSPPKTSTGVMKWCIHNNVNNPDATAVARCIQQYDPQFGHTTGAPPCTASAMDKYSSWSSASQVQTDKCATPIYRQENEDTSACRWGENSRKDYGMECRRDRSVDPEQFWAPIYARYPSPYVVEYCNDIAQGDEAIFAGCRRHMEKWRR